MIFQVKLSRRPNNLSNPEKWVTDVVKGELPKIKTLARQGASQYKLITNLSATAHLGGGSLDRVQRTLKRLVPIPAECWWSDDLDRRLENAFDLKLSYPELFTGSDFIRLLVEQDRKDPEAKRRQRAIKAYLADQYKREREVRFKQAELSNDLLGVFIDVPAAPEVAGALDWDSPAAQLAETVASIRPSWQRTRRIDELRDPTGRVSAGAGSLLLDPRFQEAAPRVVIEGAPGQGKSTMLQYACQVHRLRLLDKPEVSRLPDAHATSPVRLPMKVDLRDLAQWLTGKSSSVGGDGVPGHLRSLEGFLSAQVTAASGGVAFDVADLHAAIAESKVLLALDGLDEVVDIADRASVIDAITDGISRLDPNAASLQVVVTSRPTSFVGAETLPDALFQQMRLQSVSRELIDDYAEKWMAARELDELAQQEFTEVLDAKLQLAHIRDLARNPMQLAILLNLIHRRSRALPDQRTALYSSYMEAFLDREAGKSKAVQHHRGLLMTLHGHIAWLLHCQAERSGEIGSLTTKEVENIVEDFLVGKGHEPDLFGDLFAGAFDRVGVLVSRVQDTYEFEVQPLREFFAARYLYQTAPHSSAGKVRAGTRPERFDAIVRHPYWLNVTRFYAGSYDIGELSSLADHLTRLRKDPVWRFTPHPRMVTAQLLADWIFQQEMGVQERVVALLTKELNRRAGVSDQHDPYTALQSSMAIPGDCGGGKVAADALRLLRKERRWDRQVALASVVNAQMPDVEERKSYWKEGLDGLKGADRDNWIRASYHLRLSQALSPGDLGDLGRLSKATVEAILYAELFDVFDDGENRAGQAIDAILNRPEAGQVGPLEDPHPLPTLSESLRLDALLGRERTLQRLSGAVKKTSEAGEGFSVVCAFLSTVHGLVKAESSSWRTSVAPWNVLVEEGRRLFGERLAFDDLAVVAGGVPDRKDRGRGHADLFDDRMDLCRRARHARLRTGDADWWSRTIDEARNDDDLVLASALCWSWASESTLEALHPSLVEIHERLDGPKMDRLVNLINRARAFSEVKASGISRIDWLEGQHGPSVFACISGRLPDRLALDGVGRYGLVSRKITNKAVLDRVWAYQRRILARDPEQWEAQLEPIASHYKSLHWAPNMGFSFTSQLSNDLNLPLDVARKIIKSSAQYPVGLVARAETLCMSSAQAELESVGDIAERDNWFKRVT